VDNNDTIDEEPPKITLIGPDTIFIPLKDPMNRLNEWKTKYTVTDNKDPDLF
jgi:hypothetical protein